MNCFEKVMTRRRRYLQLSFSQAFPLVIALGSDVSLFDSLGPGPLLSLFPPNDVPSEIAYIIFLVNIYLFSHDFSCFFLRSGSFEFVEKLSPEAICMALLLYMFFLSEPRSEEDSSLGFRSCLSLPLKHIWTPFPSGSLISSMT